MEKMDNGVLSLVLAKLEVREVVRLRQVSKGFRDRLDSKGLTLYLLSSFPRVKGGYVQGATFAQAARRWAFLRVSTSCYSAYFSLAEQGVTALTWSGDDRVWVGCQNGAHEWDIGGGVGGTQLELGASVAEVGAIGSMVVVWSSEGSAVFWGDNGQRVELIGPTSNIVNRQVATVDARGRKLLIFDLEDLDHPNEEIDARLPPALLFRARIFLASDAIFLCTAGYRLAYSRVTGEVFDDGKSADVQLATMPLGLAIIEGSGEKRVWRFHDRRLVIKLDEPYMQAVIGDYTVIRHLVDAVARESLFDRKGAFVGHLDQHYDFYAFDGVRLAAGDKKGVHLYRVTGEGVRKEGELPIPGKPTALAFTVHYLVVGTKSGTLLRFPLVDPAPAGARGLKRLLSRLKR